MNNLVILGATSSIAQAIAQRYANKDSHFHLLGRSKERLEVVANHLRSHEAKVDILLVESGNEESIAQAVQEVFKSPVDLLLVAQGLLLDQPELEADPARIREMITANLSDIASFLTRSIKPLEQQGRGVVSVISSVAGDRGRKKLYAYSATKAALSTFMQGYRARLIEQGITIQTIKPGFVDTPMTAHMKKGILFASPETVADNIVKRINQKRSGTFYVPGFWWAIMMVIKFLPEVVIRKLNI